MELNNISKYISNMVESIENPSHKKDAKEYLLIRESIDKVTEYTRRNDIQALLTLDKFLKKKQYQNATQDDMIKWERFLETDLKLGEATINTYEICIKRFYKYLSDKKTYNKGRRFQKNIQYPDCVIWISGTQRNNTTLPLDKILDHEGLMKMLNACDNLRDQAMIISFYDAGLRNSELISLNIESLSFDQLGAYFILPKGGKDLKTGQRKIRLFLVPSSTQYLKDYINKHPFKQFGKAPLFYTRDARVYPMALQKANNGAITQEDFEKLRLARVSIKDIVKNIGIRASVPIRKPHDLRHNSCTIASKMGLNEMELRIRYGWSSTSKMPSRYVHLASKDLDDKIKVLTGFKEPEKPENGVLQTIICWNCNEENVPTNKFCGRCSANLSPEKEEITGDAITMGLQFQQLSKNPDFLEKLLNLVADELQQVRKKEEKNK